MSGLGPRSLFSFLSMFWAGGVPVLSLHMLHSTSPSTLHVTGLYIDPPKARLFLSRSPGVEVEHQKASIARNKEEAHEKRSLDLLSGCPVWRSLSRARAKPAR